MFPVALDGRFRIEDITPGACSLSSTAGSTPGVTHHLTVSASREGCAGAENQGILEGKHRPAVHKG